MVSNSVIIDFFGYYFCFWTEKTGIANFVASIGGIGYLC